MLNLLVVLFYILFGAIILSGGINVSSVMGMTAFSSIAFFALYELNKKK